MVGRPTKGVFRYNWSDDFDGPVLVPADSRAKIITDAMAPDGKGLMWVHNARWPEHHNLAWLVFDKIGEAIGKPGENIALWLKYETGRFDYVALPDGRVVEHPHSLKFESMSQAEFQRFWDDALEIIKEKILPNISAEKFEEIRTMINGRETIR